MKQKKTFTAYFMVHAAAIAAIYVVLTMLFAPISFGPVQFRISEALCILPYFTPAAVPGVFLGCLLSNLLCGAAALDVIFGSLATLIGALGTYALRRHKFLLTLPPVLSNAIIIPFVLKYVYYPDVAYHLFGIDVSILFYAVTVGVGEIISVCLFGSILLRVLRPLSGTLGWTIPQKKAANKATKA